MDRDRRGRREPVPAPKRGPDPDSIRGCRSRSVSAAVRAAGTGLLSVLAFAVLLAAAPGDARAQTTITGIALSSPSFIEGTTSVNEDAGAITVTVTATVANKLPVDFATLYVRTGQGHPVTTRTSPGDISGGKDFSSGQFIMNEANCGSSGGMTLWSQNQCRRTLTFTIVDDDTEETDERVTIIFGTYSGNLLQSSAQADITIVDNDEAPNTPPRVTTTGITVDENTERTTALERTDDEPEDLAGHNWQLRDGAGDDDNDKFTISTSGRLTFKTPPDYENPDDADLDRIYKIRVRAATGTVARGTRWSDDAEVTVTVADANEPPEAVTNIRRTARDNNSQTIAWNAPTETDRPPVTQYRVWRKWHGVVSWDDDSVRVSMATGTSHRITGLVAGSRYDVRVAALNDEGLGDPATRSNADQTTTGTAPAASVTVSETAVTVTEDGTTTDTFTVKLDTKPRADVTVDVSVTAGATVSPSELTFTEDNYSTTQTVTVTGAHDADADDDTSTVTLEIDSDDGRFDDLSDPTVAVTVNDDDTQLAKPAKPSLTQGDTQLGVSWSTVMNASGYRVEWTCAGTTKSRDESDQTTSTTIGSLMNGVACSVTVRALGSGADTGTGFADSDRSDAETETPQQTVNSPPAVTTTALTVAENVMQVPDKVVATDPEGDTISRYELAGSGVDNDKFTIDSAGVLRFETAPNHENPHDSDNNNVYDITVTATSGSPPQTSAQQAITVTVTNVQEPPEAPADPTITEETDNSFKVSWQPPANTGPPINQYDVEYKEDAATQWQEASGEPTSGTLEVTVSGLNAATDYDVRVRASNPEGDGAWSSDGGVRARTLTPQLDTPGNLVLTAGDGEIAVSWGSVTNATGYRVDWTCGTTPGSATTAAGVTSYTITSLANGTACTVEVTATAGASFTASEPASGTATPVADPNNPATGAPTITHETPPLVGQTLMAGTSAIADADGLGSFSYQWIRRSGGTDSDISGATNSTYTILTDDRGKTIKVRVSFTDGRDFSESRTSAATPSVKQKLDVPGSFAATGGDAAVSFTWDTVTGASGYAVTRTSPGAAVTQTVSGGSTSSANWTQTTDLTNGQTYTFTIRATGTGDYVDSDESDADSAQPNFAGAASAAISSNQSPLTEANIGGSTLTVDLTNADFAASGTLTSANFSLITTPPTSGLGVQQIQRDGNKQVTVTVRATNFNIGSNVLLAVRIDAAGIVHSGTGGLDSGTVTVETVNVAPRFSGNLATRIFNRPENQTAVGTVSATDTDPEDSVTYALSGLDAEHFTLGATSGVLAFADEPDFERGSGGGLGGTSNTYTFTVTATGGTDGRAMTAMQEITVNVTNVGNERPGKPGAPTFGTTTVNSIVVNWTAPDNEGPTTLTYDLRWQPESARENVDGDWEDGPQNEAASPATITDSNIVAGTRYRVQVRAANADGDGPWSDSAVAETAANAGPVFTGGATRILTANENQTAADTIVATDADDGDNIESYAIVGGANGGLFSITSPGGVLTFDTAPNFEEPKGGSGGNSNDYEVVVRATSGTGARVLTTEQTVTVRVTNDGTNEVPDKPDPPGFTIAGITPVKLPVTWTAPTNPGPPILHHDLQYRVNGSSGAWSPLADRSGTTADISGLMPGVTYEVQVRAVNNDGDGPWSDSATRATASNAPPVFGANTTSFDVDENTPAGTAVGTVTASDSDGADEIESYSLGGTDAGLFDITNAGALSFKAVPNFEAARSNVYTMTVTVTSGTGDREATAEQTVTVTVDDVIEAPEKPAKPTPAGSTVNSVTVMWSEPGNTGPAITDYDVRWREQGTSGWTELPDTGTEADNTALTATISGLDQNKTYEVQVRAENDEGMSGWSSSGTPSTSANAAPVFAAGTDSFSLQENDGRTVGTVTATDSDDAIVKYEITGGADESRFSITSPGGVLRFNDPPPDFEAMGSAAGDNAYKVVVTVTSGTGDREATATQTVTVTVTDDTTEAPDVPNPPTLMVVDYESLSVSWDEPDNLGPSPITYDLQYRLSGDTGWTDGPADVAGLTRIIDGLGPGALYVARVRAKNDEGASGWSQPSTTAVATHHNRPPTFASTVANYDVQENTTAVTTVTATDLDAAQVPADATITYALEGVDGSRFRIASNGVLTFESGKNYEDPDDADTDGVYEVAVRATSGAAGTAREMSTTRSFTVTLQDAGGEGPGAPAAPTLDMATVNSLRASWSAPATNPGPDINDYDVRWQPTSADPNDDDEWTDLDDTTPSTDTSATIGDLDAGTSYRVQVRAQNAEAAGAWSPSSQPLTTDANNPPTFDSAASFTVDENTPATTPVVTVMASDPDTTFGDAITTYALSGDDHTKFTLTSPGGVLTFNAVPDYEAPVDVGGDNVYNITVTATSGTGARALSAMQPITVTVDNVDETPIGKPTISGDVQVGGTLMADASDIVDPDTPAGPTFAWQWNRVDTDNTATPITGANAGENTASYTAQEADGGLRLSVTVSWTDGFGANEMATSDPTGRVATKPEAPTGVNATFSGNGFSISWNAPSDGGSPVTAYEYRFGTTGAWLSTGNSNTSRNFTSLNLLHANRDTTFQVRAVNAVGPGSEATIVLNRTMQVNTPTVSLSLDPTTINESGTDNSATLTVTLDGTDTTADTVFSVPAHDEYGSSPASRTIAAGSGARTTTFTITATDDNIFEGNRTVEVPVTVTYTGSPAIPDPAPASLNIDEDDLEPPAQVTNVQVTPGVESLTVTWDEAARATGYTVQWRLRTAADYTDPNPADPADGGETTTVAGTETAEITGLDADEEYTVQVIATRTGADDGQPSDDTQTEATGMPRARPPGQPGNVAASADSVDGAEAGEIVVTWSAAADADGYRVQWKSGSQEYHSSREETVDGGDTLTATVPGPTDPRLTAGTPHTVRVIATRDNADDGPPSLDAMATPRAPTPAQVMNVEVTAPGIEQLLVTWDAVPGADAYRVQWHSGGSYDPTSTDPSVAGEAEATGTRHTLENLEPGTLYTVRVIATREHADDGPASLESQGSPSSGPPPGQVGGVRLTVQEGALLVRWNAVSDSGGYRVQWKSGSADYDPDNADPTVAGEAAVTGTATTAYTIADLTGGTPYTVRVIATRIGAEDGPPSAERRAAPRAAPTEVSNVQVKQGVGTLIVTWVTVPSATGYEVQWKSGMQGYNTSRQATASGGSTDRHVIPGLNAGTEYTVRVRATLPGGEEGPYSREDRGTPGTAGQVLNVEVTPGVRRLAVSWDPLADASGYRVQWKSGSAEYDPDNSAPAVAGEATPDATRHDITGLRARTEYTVRVIGILGTAENPRDGPPSLEIRGRPRAPAPPPPPPETASAAIVASDPDPLTEQALQAGTAMLTVEVAETAWVAAPEPSAFTFSLAGVSVAPDGVRRESDTQAVLTLAFDGDLEEAAELSATVRAAAHTGSGDLVTNAVPVTVGSESAAIVATDPDPLTEESLDGARLTVALAGTAWVAAPAADDVMVSGVPGATVGAVERDADDPAHAVVTLAWDGTELESGAALRLTVGAGAHEGEGDLVTNAVPVAVGPASAAIVATDPDPLREETLDGARLTVALAGTAWVATPSADDVTVSGVPGATAGAVERDADDSARAVVTLAWDGTDLEADAELTLTVGAGAHEGEGDLVTNAVPVRATVEPSTARIVATDPDPLSEETLDGARLTVVLGGSAWVAAPAADDVTVSGVPGLSVGTVARDAIVPERAVVALVHDGTDFDADAELTLTVGAGAHEREGDLTTNTVPVSATVEPATARIAATRPDPLTENALNAGNATLTVEVAETAWVAAPEPTAFGFNIAGLRVAPDGVHRASDTRVVLALAFSGDIETRTELRVTVGAAAHARPGDIVTTNTVPVTPAADASLGRVAKEWLSLFGRTVAAYVMDAIGERLARDASSGSQATIGGQALTFAGAVPLAPALQAGHATTVSATPYVLDASDGAATRSPGGAGADHRTVAGRELLTTSAFHLSTTEEGETAADGGVSVWGTAQATRVDDESGGLSLEGDVMTATLGVDYQRGPMVAGVALSQSEGDGEFEALAGAGAAEDGGKLDASLGAVHPYARFQVDERSALWAMLGYGQGEMELAPRAGGAVETDIEMRMAALGARRVLVAPEEAKGFELAANAEAFVVEMQSEASGDEAALSLDAASVQERALRLSLEGGYEYQLDGDTRLRPSFELGLRHDTGDADTGTGLELGAGLSYVDAAGVRVEANARALLARQGERDEWGAGGALHLDFDSDRRGLILSLSPSWGEAGGGAERLWERGFAAATGDGEPSPALRFEAEAGYGIPVLGDRALFTPRAGFELSGSESRRYRLRLDLEQDDQKLGIGLEGFRHERDGEVPDHGIGVRARMRW